MNTVRLRLEQHLNASACIGDADVCCCLREDKHDGSSFYSQNFRARAFSTYAARTGQGASALQMADNGLGAPLPERL
jgi:hypothetical protein